MFSATLSGISELFQFKDFLERFMELSKVVIFIVRIMLQSKMMQIRITKEKGAENIVQENLGISF